MFKKLNICAWCGFNVFMEFSSWWEICPICRFQDSVLWVYQPFLPSCNWDLTLLDFQKKTIENIPFNLFEIEIKWSKYYRNKDWLPIDIDKLNKKYIYFPWYSYYQLNTPRKDVIKDFEKAQKYNPDNKVHLEKY